PVSLPLSGLSICAEGERVIVREGARRWQAESGQYLFAFEADPSSGALSVIERKAPAPPARAQEWLDQGVALEDADPQAALRAYEQAIAADAGLLDAHLNLGSLLHATGRLSEA